MANIPDGTYSVNLGSPSDNWANGALVVSGTAPNQTATYKGNTVTGLNTSTTNVSWNVTVTHAGNQCALAFTGGQYSAASGNGAITGGSVTGGCLAGLPADGSDTWSADLTLMEGSKHYKGAHGH